MLVDGFNPLKKINRITNAQECPEGTTEVE